MSSIGSGSRALCVALLVFFAGAEVAEAKSCIKIKKWRIICIKSGPLPPADNRPPGPPLPLEKVEPPSFWPAPGEYQGWVHVSMSTTTPAASIVYTIDGTNPALFGIPHLMSLRFSCSVTVRAIARRTGWIDSTMVTATYTIKPWRFQSWGNPTVGGTLVGKFGCARGGCNRCNPANTGIDVAMSVSTMVRAVASGYVSFVGSDRVRITHTKSNGQPDGYETEYSQLSNTSAVAGQNVVSGTQIGTASPELHFVVTLSGRHVDPLEHIAGYADVDWCGARSCGGCSQLCNGAAPAPISWSGTGGLESEPMWLSRLRAGDTVPAPLWKWANGPFRPRAPRPAAAITQTHIALADLAHAAFPEMDVVAGEPKEVIGNSNATEALGADFKDKETKQTLAAMNIFRTEKSVYSHDYAVCQRFKGSTFDLIAPLEFSDEEEREPAAYFWAARRRNTQEQTEEEAITFAVHVSADEQRFTVDSRWLADEYPAASEGSMLAFQLWGVDLATVATMADNILEYLRTRGMLLFRNTTEPALPKFRIADAQYGHGKGTLTIVNDGDVPSVLKIHASTWSAPHPGSDRKYEFEHVIPPGTSVVTLPMPGMLNGVVYASDGIFTDKVYIADGHWFAFDDSGSGGTSSAELVSENCRARTDQQSHELLVAGCGELRGSVTPRGWAGMARALNPTTRSMLDVSDYNALTFFTRGDGKTYRFGLETHSIARLETTDWHQLAFAAPPEGRQITIPFHALEQQGWDAAKVQALTTHDVRALVWSTIGEPHDAVRLFIDNVSFTRAAVLTQTTFADHVIRSRITDDTAPSAAVVYSVDGGRTFHRVVMRADGEQYTAEIPRQAPGTEVRFYVEAEGSAGTVATDPVNAPFAIHRVRIGGLPQLLVDDFADTDPANVLGGNSSLFGTDTGSTITVRFENAARFDYDVTAPLSYAGYYTLLGGIDGRPYDTLRFRIRGANGRETLKVGLRTHDGREQKLPLPVTVGTAWKDVILPLTLFRELHDLSSLHSIVIAFEQRTGSGRGTVYIDDLELGSTKRRAR